MDCERSSVKTTLFRSSDLPAQVESRLRPSSGCSKSRCLATRCMLTPRLNAIGRISKARLIKSDMEGVRAMTAAARDPVDTPVVKR